MPSCHLHSNLCSSGGGHFIDWLADQQRVTNRLAESVIYLCSQLSIQHVAKFYRLHWHTVKRVDKRALKARLDPADFSDVRVIGMDEFALHKGHCYATVVVDPIRKRVIWVGPGRDSAAVRKFFEQLGPEQCERIEAAVMDMHPAFTLEVERHCPNARIVYDLFHVIAKYSREVVDRVRVDQANALRRDKAARKFVKASKWQLLRSPRNTNRAQRVRLQELFDANTPLMTTYMLRGDLKALWSHTRTRREAPGRTGISALWIPALRPPSALQSVSRPWCRASSPMPSSRYTRASSRASTTRSRSPSRWSTASAMMSTSSSRSEPLTPVMRNEPE